ncbi:G2E3 ligase, partial [Polyodon spathula]|nr:G2E3 ligase [Polyodon spathula]
MLVTFTDGPGSTEDGIDAGGSKAILQLLMQHLRSQRVFEWKENDKYLRCESTALENILMFAAGLSVIPPLGFHPKPYIQSLHSGSPLTTANTCSNILNLPIHNTCESFKFHISFGILNSPGFGQY